VNWATVICVGAAGGAIVSVVAFCGDVFTWQQTRRTAHLNRRAAHARHAVELPTLRKYIDPWPDFVALLTRIVLGVLAGAVFRFQVTTPQAAFMVGASAPALLTQLGNARMAKPADGGTEPPTVPAMPFTVPDMPGSEKG
jgi:hypothetical protein